MSYQPNPIITEIPADDIDSSAVALRALPQHISRIGFTKVLSNTVDPAWGTIVGGIGSGMDVDQTGGNLVITTGITARAETIIRSTADWQGGIRLRVRNTLSQRIINQNFFVELVDVIGDSLSYNISSATTIVVTIPSNPFTDENIGQSMYIGGFSGTGTFLSGRYPIASIAGNNVTFTVSAFAVGTGTCSLFGWNYYQLQYTGATATVTNFDTQRNGWASGVSSPTTLTSAAPGHLAIITGNDLVATYADQLVASSSTIQQTVRATRVENVPDDTSLRLQIRVNNGSTAPVSTTTWTIGMVSISNYANQDVSIQDVRPMSVGTAVPVEILRGVTQAVSGTVTSNIGTGTLAAVTSANLGLPSSITDVASAALTTTTTTAAITPTFGISYQVVIPVTATTGTTPTLDVRIEESDDGGTNWFTIYTFERITGNGVYRSPLLPLVGNRVRYVQTVGGTTPSFTRSVQRLQSSQPTAVLRRDIDRTVVLTTLNSVTPAIVTGGAANLSLTINIGAATTAPVLQLEGSEDNGLTYYPIGSGTALPAIANSTVNTTLNGYSPQLIRARVSTAGSGVTMGYVSIKCF